MSCNLHGSGGASVLLGRHNPHLLVVRGLYKVSRFPGPSITTSGESGDDAAIGSNEFLSLSLNVVYAATVQRSILNFKTSASLDISHACFDRL